MTDIKGLTASEERRVYEFVSVLRTPCRVVVNPDYGICSEDFENEFRSKLLTHHCFIGSPLFQDSFEGAFIDSCQYAGHKVVKAPEGQRFWDVEVNGRKISLKSSKAKDLREETLHISKLTEAAWIQDCRTASMRREKTLELFRDYCDQVDCIIQLRYFRLARKYELVEVPSALFLQILCLEKEHFASEGPTISVPIGQEPPDFTLKLDRSDAKIIITHINKGLCRIHGTWVLENGIDVQ